MSSEEDCFHLGIKALIRNEKGQLLLLKKNTKNPSDVFWDLPGGRIQKNESLEETLKREVFEETGLKNLFRITPFMMTVTNKRIKLPAGDVGLIFKVYVCDVADSSSIALSDEHIHHEWFDPTQAADLLSKSFPSELTEKLSNFVDCLK